MNIAAISADRLIPVANDGVILSFPKKWRDIEASSYLGHYLVARRPGQILD